MTNNIRIGILGGSFDPPHIGHIFVSELAKKKLGLQEVTWIISRQNPLKSKSSNFTKRVFATRRFVSCHKKNFIKISEAEKYHKISRSFVTLKRIIKANKNIKPVWIIGSDCLAHFHKWYRHEQILRMIKIIIIERKSQNNTIKTFQKKFRSSQAYNISDFLTKESQWIYIRAKTPNISSSKIKNWEIRTIT